MIKIGDVDAVLDMKGTTSELLADLTVATKAIWLIAIKDYGPKKARKLINEVAKKAMEPDPKVDLAFMNLLFAKGGHKDDKNK